MHSPKQLDYLSFFINVFIICKIRDGIHNIVYHEIGSGLFQDLLITTCVHTTQLLLACAYTTSAQFKVSVPNILLFRTE